VIEESAVEELLHVRLDSLERVTGGGNNVALRARSGGRSWLVKDYGHHPGGGRDRLEREFSLLSFLWKEGVRATPEPIAADRERSLAAYSWVEGVRPAPGEIAPGDVSALALFLGTLWTLRERPGAKELPLAVEATFSARELVQLVERRTERLRSGVERDALGEQALAFLEGDLAAAFRSIRERVGESDALLPPSERTLSPSDHGFHNALRTSSGWVFLDFEYGGWDDPAKMLADALLQPAVPIPETLRTAFLEEMRRALGPETGLYARFRRLYPLWSLKWCLIFLNEFLPQGRERRRRAGGDPALDTRPVQLEKARARLDRLKNEL
jgi:hypothetical protein